MVLVHGSISDNETWESYLGQDGFLSELGLQGFAVGDDVAEGVLNTGNRLDPSQPIKTISENAEALQDYIAGVKGCGWESLTCNGRDQCNKSVTGISRIII